MEIITLYYFIGFIVFVLMLIGIQQTLKLPPQKKQIIGFSALVLFIISLLMFVIVVKSNFIDLSSDAIIFTSMFFFFLLNLFTALFLIWYNKKYNKKINIGAVIIFICLCGLGTIYLFLKNMGDSDKESLVKNITIKSTITNITFDVHKPYFKNMTLADGQYLPMPEAMNNILQIGDSIYKNKNEGFYKIINIKTKTATKYPVDVHQRVLGKAN